MTILLQQQHKQAFSRCIERRGVCFSTVSSLLRSKLLYLFLVLLLHSISYSNSWSPKRLLLSKIQPRSFTTSNTGSPLLPSSSYSSSTSSSYSSLTSSRNMITQYRIFEIRRTEEEGKYRSKRLFLYNAIKRMVSSDRKSSSQQQKDDKNGNNNIALLQAENTLLRDAVRQLEEENDNLRQHANRIVLETFEGEGKLRERNNNAFGQNDTTSMMDTSGITMSGVELEQDAAALWCDELEEDGCPIEPVVSFGEALRDRAYWLVGLLIMQSFSGFILSRNEALLANHPVIIYFLTMLVGAGGNAGNQASVRVIRGLALGTLNDQTRNQFLNRELKMALALSMILSLAGFCRAIFFKTPLPEAIAITSALALIVFSSICLGAILPLILEFIGVDPAHSSTTIQVIMDILGVIMAVTVSKLILDGPLGGFLISRLGG